MSEQTLGSYSLSLLKSIADSEYGLLLINLNHRQLVAARDMIQHGLVETTLFGALTRIEATDAGRAALKGGEE